MFAELLSDLVVILLFAFLLEFRLVLFRACFCFFISRVFLICSCYCCSVSCLVLCCN